MKMVNLKIPKREKEKNILSQPEAPEPDRWPYGLRLIFESEQIDKLPHLEKLKVGQKVDIGGTGEVSSIRMHEEKEGKKKYTVEIQLHEVGCEGKGKAEQETMGMAIARRHRSSMYGES